MGCTPQEDTPSSLCQELVILLICQPLKQVNTSLERAQELSTLPYGPLPASPVLPCGSSGALAQGSTAPSLSLLAFILDAPSAQPHSQTARASHSTSQDSRRVFRSKVSSLFLLVSDLLGCHSEAISSQRVLKVGFCFYFSAFWESPFLKATARLKTLTLALSHIRACLPSSLLPARIQSPANLSNNVLLKPIPQPSLTLFTQLLL